MVIRPAHADDFLAIAAITNHYIVHTAIPHRRSEVLVGSR
jgi:hypothetical protein